MSAEHDPLREAREYQRALVRACLTESAGHEPPSPGTAPRGWDVYRRLMRSGLRATIEVVFDRTREQIGAERFAALESDFFHAQPPRGLLSSALSLEFIEFLSRRLDQDPSALPPWALDLARFEQAEFAVASEQDDPTEGLEPPVMTRPLVLSSALRVLRLDHRAHDHDEQPPPPTPTVSVCVYREPGTWDVDALELDAFTAALLTWPGTDERSLAERVRYAAGCTGTTLDEAWLETFKTLLSDLIDRGIVLGSRPPPAS